MPNRFGPYGGAYVPETLVPALEELARAWEAARHDPEFRADLHERLSRFAGRPTPLSPAPRLSRRGRGAEIWLKREDLLHGGAHKINNALGQAVLARRMGKRRIIAETGAGQHGVATAMVGAALGLETVVYMGERDIERQHPNVLRMRLLGTRIIPVKEGSRTLKDAINAALRDWIENLRTSHYLIGSVVGPHPFPTLVREFQSVIGKEILRQSRSEWGGPPDLAVACVGGGSNAIGTFYPILRERTELLGVEAGGPRGHPTGAASLTRGTPGVLHGSYSYLLQDQEGQVAETASLSAGLDYPGVGPEHAYLRDSKRARYISIHDDEALRAFHWLSEDEGILPALESAHAIYAAVREARRRPHQRIVVTLSGRGDKDLEALVP
jgi:tryptophan synthase beta chain